MKLTILGAGGFRTPLLMKSLFDKFIALGFEKIALYDIDPERIKIVCDLLLYAIQDDEKRTHIGFVENANEALKDADFVITTFRIGGMESRILDERIPLKHGILGQETTGPGGFSMALRSIPVMMDYLEIMRKVCPNAWIINFANPSGLMTEAIIKIGGWKKVIGICDGPESIRLYAAKYLVMDQSNIDMEYFGLNHLGWVRKVLVQGQDILPTFIEQLPPDAKMPGQPFSGQLIKNLKMFPNEYLYYYYNRLSSVKSILDDKQTRGEYLLELNNEFIKEINKLRSENRYGEMWESYWSYINDRSQSYMKHAKEPSPIETNVDSDDHLGYANVAFRVIEGLISGNVTSIINIPNAGAITGMGDEDVVEIPAQISHGHISPKIIGKIPDHCLALMMQVKEYEKLVIKGIKEKSYATCLQALTIHPLVMDEQIAKKILDEYVLAFNGFYPFLG
jgi:6-phospho-beta-glucosidase